MKKLKKSILFTISIFSILVINCIATESKPKEFNSEDFEKVKYL